MKKIFCSSKNLRNFTHVLSKKMNLTLFADILPVQEHFDHWNHKPVAELRSDFLNTILTIKKKALSEGFTVCFAFEDFSDFNPAEQVEISDGCQKFTFSNTHFNNFNELILGIGKKSEAINCIRSYMNCLNGYIDVEKTLPATDTLILNYTEIYKTKLKQNFDIKNIEFENEDLWDLESDILNDFKSFIV